MNKIKVYNEHYKIDGVDYDRLTSVLNYFVPRGLHDWALKVGKVESERIKKKAMAIGSRTDGIITKFIQTGKYEDYSSDILEVRNCMEGWHSYLSDENPKIINAQVTGYSELYKVAGTYDILTDKVLVDVKCANMISKSYWIQTAMYIFMNKLKVERMGILRLDKMMGDYEYVERDYEPKYVYLFLGLLDYYRYDKKPKYKPKKKEVKKYDSDEVARAEVRNKYGF